MPALRSTLSTFFSHPILTVTFFLLRHGGGTHAHPHNIAVKYQHFTQESRFCALHQRRRRRQAPSLQIIPHNSHSKKKSEDPSVDFLTNPHTHLLGSQSTEHTHARQPCSLVCKDRSRCRIRRPTQCSGATSTASSAFLPSRWRWR